MKRQYKNNPSNNVQFFIAKEIEHTPAYELKTLFVVGLQDIEDIEDILQDPYTSISGPIEHIFFGANQSFPKIDTNDFSVWSKWEKMIQHFLNNKYFCTLDLDISCVEGLSESGLCEHNLFIPLISAKIPYINLLNYNACLKIDDKSLDATNPGIWCHMIHDLKDRSKFTHWKLYDNDEVIK